MTTSISDNGLYPKICEKASVDDDLFKVFKQIPGYRQILEHASYEQGKLYLDCIVDDYGEEDAIEMCRDAMVNDLYGGSQPMSFYVGDEILSITPSTLRYVKVWTDLIDNFELSKMNVCEIGGGYGGQCLVANELSGFSSWDIVDLKEANKLQERYISNHDIENVRFLSLENIDEVKSEYDLVISNYAFSECNKQIQDIYVNKIIKNSKHGYMTMNFISSEKDLYDYKSLSEHVTNIQDKDEVPNTFHSNRLFLW